MTSWTRLNALPGVRVAVLALGLLVSGCSDVVPTPAGPLVPVSSALPPPTPTATRTPSATSPPATAAGSQLPALDRLAGLQDMAVVTLYRWTNAIPEYAGNHDGYRR